MQAVFPVPLTGQDSTVSIVLAMGWTVKVSRYSTPVHTSPGAQPIVPGFLPRGKAVRTSCDEVKERVEL